MPMKRKAGDNTPKKRRRGVRTETTAGADIAGTTAQTAGPTADPSSDAVSGISQELAPPTGFAGASSLPGAARAIGAGSGQRGFAPPYRQQAFAGKMATRPAFDVGYPGAGGSSQFGGSAFLAASRGGFSQSNFRPTPTPMVQPLGNPAGGGSAPFTYVGPAGYGSLGRGDGGAGTGQMGFAPPHRQAFAGKTATPPASAVGLSGGSVQFGGGVSLAAARGGFSQSRFRATPAPKLQPVGNPAYGFVPGQNQMISPRQKGTEQPRGVSLRPSPSAPEQQPSSPARAAGCSVCGAPTTLLRGVLDLAPLCELCRYIFHAGAPQEQSGSSSSAPPEQQSSSRAPTPVPSYAYAGAPKDQSSCTTSPAPQEQSRAPGPVPSYAGAPRAAVPAAAGGLDAEMPAADTCKSSIYTDAICRACRNISGTNHKECRFCREWIAYHGKERP